MREERYAVMQSRLASCSSRCYWSVMQYNLVPHPSTPPGIPDLKVWAMVEHAAALAAVATTNIWYGVGAPAERFLIAEPVEPKRADELWKTTCFEAFLRPLGEQSYR